MGQQEKGALGRLRAEHLGPRSGGAHPALGLGLASGSPGWQGDPGPLCHCRRCSCGLVWGFCYVLFGLYVF